MKAIILAAGLGSRLASITAKMPKCLVEINGITIIEKCLENIKCLEVEEVVIVGGYLFQLVKQHLKNFQDMKIKYVTNSKYNISGTAYSLLKGLENMSLKDDLLVIEGDVFFESSMLNDYQLSLPHNFTYVEKYNDSLDGTFVELDPDGKVIRWLHKDMRKAGEKVKHMFKTINIHKFTRKFVENYLLSTLKHEMQNNINISLEYVMHKIISSNSDGEVFALQNKSRKWVEIDDKNDMNLALSVFK